MSQVNVNTPGGEPAPVRDGSGYGMIVGILLAILVIALVLWLLVFNRPADEGTPVNGDTEESMPESSFVWSLVDIA